MTSKQPDLIHELPFVLEGYKFVEVLGSGGFSTVFKVKHLSSDQYFAAKSCKINRDDSKKRDVALAEMKSLKELYHPNIIKIYDIIEGYDHIFMILEYMPGGSLSRVVRHTQGLRYTALVSAMYQLLSAVEFCHSLNIAHRDIKPDNVLFDNINRCVLSDFGLSCTMNSEHKSKDFSGSLPYKAPEILRHVEYDPFKADIWALGVSFYVMATGSLPWSRNSDMRAMIINGFFIVPKNIPVAIQEIIKSTMNIDPNKRPTAYELLDLPIFKQTIERTPLSSEASHTSLTLSSMKNLGVHRQKKVAHKSMSVGSFRSLLNLASLDSPLSLEIGENNKSSMLLKPHATEDSNKNREEPSSLPPLKRRN